MMPQHYDNQIRALRASTALSQAAFAERYGIPRRTVEDWETGKRQPPGYVIDLLQFRIDHDNARRE